LGGELVEGIGNVGGDAVADEFRQGAPDAEEVGDGPRALEGKADVAGIVVGGQGPGVGLGGEAGEEHDEQTAQGDADEGDLVVKGGGSSVGGEVVDLVGLVAAGIEAVDSIEIASVAPLLRNDDFAAALRDVWAKIR
jgi:hypothetical protein